ncbi:hypothetical protein VTK73DRAFT_8772 [Phialemonium thermophilum]|uniref:Uncharacterized protein n=1 Tax=Phialemonium thermophilum TaxID=223376 RepID=A0ABR3XNP2_9PEZI
MRSGTPTGVMRYATQLLTRRDFAIRRSQSYRGCSPSFASPLSCFTPISFASGYDITLLSRTTFHSSTSTIFMGDNIVCKTLQGSTISFQLKSLKVSRQNSPSPKLQLAKPLMSNSGSGFTTIDISSGPRVRRHSVLSDFLPESLPLGPLFIPMAFSSRKFRVKTSQNVTRTMIDTDARRASDAGSESTETDPPAVK